MVFHQKLKIFDTMAIMLWLCTVSMYAMASHDNNDEPIAIVQDMHLQMYDRIDNLVCERTAKGQIIVPIDAMPQGHAIANCYCDGVCIGQLTTSPYAFEFRASGREKKDFVIAAPVHKDLLQMIMSNQDTIGLHKPIDVHTCDITSKIVRFLNACTIKEKLKIKAHAFDSYADISTQQFEFNGNICNIMEKGSFKAQSTVFSRLQCFFNMGQVDIQDPVTMDAQLFRNKGMCTMGSMFDLLAGELLNDGTLQVGGTLHIAMKKFKNKDSENIINNNMIDVGHDLFIHKVNHLITGDRSCIKAGRNIQVNNAWTMDIKNTFYGAESIVLHVDGDVTIYGHIISPTIFIETDGKILGKGRPSINMKKYAGLKAWGDIIFHGCIAGDLEKFDQPVKKKSARLALENNVHDSVAQNGCNGMQLVPLSAQNQLIDRSVNNSQQASDALMAHVHPLSSSIEFCSEEGNIYLSRVLSHGRDIYCSAEHGNVFIDDTVDATGNRTKSRLWMKAENVTFGRNAYVRARQSVCVVNNDFQQEGGSFISEEEGSIYARNYSQQDGVTTGKGSFIVHADNIEVCKDARQKSVNTALCAKDTVIFEGTSHGDTLLLKGSDVIVADSASIGANRVGCDADEMTIHGKVCANEVKVQTRQLLGGGRVECSAVTIDYKKDSGCITDGSHDNAVVVPDNLAPYQKSAQERTRRVPKSREYKCVRGPVIDQATLNEQEKINQEDGYRIFSFIPGLQPPAQIISPNRAGVNNPQEIANPVDIDNPVLLQAPAEDNNSWFYLGSLVCVGAYFSSPFFENLANRARRFFNKKQPEEQKMPLMITDAPHEYPESSSGMVEEMLIQDGDVIVDDIAIDESSHDN